MLDKIKQVFYDEVESYNILTNYISHTILTKAL